MAIVKFLSSLCLCAAICAGYAAAPYSSYADEKKSEAKSDGKLDLTLFDVEEGKDLPYYRERFAKIVQMLRDLKEEPTEEELTQLNEAMLRAYPTIMKRTMNDPEDTEKNREFHFRQYLQALVVKKDVAELEAFLDSEKNETRRKAIAIALFSTKLQAAAETNDKAAVQKAAADLSDRAMNDDDLARQVPELVKKIESADANLGAETFKTIVDRFAASENELRQKLAKSYTGILRFNTLVGAEMKLEGVTLDGEEFDWDSYRGKVVLVDFFATWCGPCMGEIPSMLDNYKKYHDAGFDIVSYSVDRDLDALKKFEEEKEIPWTTISGFKSVSTKDKDGNPKYEEISDYYGINSIPRMILVGKDGKVIATNARGAELTKQLQKRFPDVK